MVESGELADLLRAGLAAAGINQAELARRAGVTRAYAGRLLAGQQAAPTPEVVAALAAALELGPAERLRLFLAAGSAPPDLAALLGRPVLARLLATLVLAPAARLERLETLLTALLDLLEAPSSGPMLNQHNDQASTAR
jgi:transcriptional regulator with XRE-family HTH domain